jgi:hypothetical protein
VKWKKAVFGLALGAILLIHLQWVWSQDTTPTPTTDAKKEEKKPKPDPSGANSGDRTVITGDQPKFKEVDADKPDLKDLASNHNEMNTFVLTMGDMAGKNRVAINMMWTLLTGFLVMFMQAGFALVETGLTRYKNVAHTMAMNFMVYGLGMLGFVDGRWQGSRARDQGVGVFGADRGSRRSPTTGQDGRENTRQDTG